MALLSRQFITSRYVDYFLRTGAAAFLIRAVALAASASFSKPNIAEYLPSHHLRHHEAQIDPRITDRFREGVAEPLPIVPLNQKRGDR